MKPQHGEAARVVAAAGRASSSSRDSKAHYSHILQGYMPVNRAGGFSGGSLFEGLTSSIASSGA